MLISFGIFWHNHLKPYVLYQKTRDFNMHGIGEGIALFNGKNNRLPKDIDEVVQAGFLPEKSELYYCPVKHNSLFSKELPYWKCEFEISFDPNIVVIHIPREVFDHTFYKRASENSRKWEILVDCKAYSTE
jgi:hypothetical protein